MPYLIFAAIGVILDQIVKYLVRANINLGEIIPVIPNVLGLTYLKNTGAAFSSFSNNTWILTIVSAVATVFLIAVIIKRPFKKKLPMFCIASVLVGAAGNLIDRALFGYVTDMFKTLFMDFAVFNVADAYLTVAVIIFIIYILFFEREASSKDDTNGESK